jgi:hypothetical protein
MQRLKTGRSRWVEVKPAAKWSVHWGLFSPRVGSAMIFSNLPPPFGEPATMQAKSRDCSQQPIKTRCSQPIGKTLFHALFTTPTLLREIYQTRHQRQPISLDCYFTM